MSPRFVLSCGLMGLLWGCSHAPMPPARSSAPPAAVAYAPGVAQSKRHDVVIQAMAMLDRGYTYGGKKLHTGFDCSGLVIPGSAADIAQASQPIAPELASPGDLVFFNTLGSPYSHVGIYIGSGKFIHAANEKTGVRVERLGSPYWSQRFQGYRSLLG